MAYTKTNWEDLPSTDTPIIADNLQNMEDGIEEAHNLIEEIKNAEIYSINEVKTNKVYVDGNNIEHPIYRKTINIGYLGNSSTVSVNHNISNLDRFFDIRGNAVREVDKDTLSIPYVTFNSNNGGGIMFYANETTIYITTSSDRSSYVGILTLEYTKTTE